jgi:hypothetical protein
MNMLLPTAAAMVNGILVGSAIVATRFVIDQSSPVSLALLRYFIGFCCLLPPIFFWPCLPPGRVSSMPSHVSRRVAGVRLALSGSRAGSGIICGSGRSITRRPQT